MATLIRSAKPGCSWTINELKAFNIQVQSLGLEQFFGITQLPAIPATIPSTILKEGDKPQGILDNGSRQFFKYLILAELRLGNDPPHVSDFVAWILRVLRFDDVDGEDRVVASHMILDLTMAGSRVDAQLDLAIVDESDILLLVQEDKVCFKLLSLNIVSL